MGMELIMENIHEANKHLTYEERTFIEIGLNQGRNYTEIAKDINKDRRTIAREIEKHKFKRKPGSFNGKKNFCERSQVQWNSLAVLLPPTTCTWHVIKDG